MGKSWQEKIYRAAQAKGKATITPYDPRAPDAAPVGSGSTKAWHQNFKRSPVEQRTDRNGIVFDSKWELHRWEYNLIRLSLGEIRNLKRQVKHDLIVNGEKIGIYTSDFEYDEQQMLPGQPFHPVVEEVKGHMDTASRQRIKTFQAMSGRKVRIVTKGKDRKSWREYHV